MINTYTRSKNNRYLLFFSVATSLNDLLLHFCIGNVIPFHYAKNLYHSVYLFMRRYYWVTNSNGGIVQGDSVVSELVFKLLFATRYKINQIGNE